MRQNIKLLDGVMRGLDHITVSFTWETVVIILFQHRLVFYQVVLPGTFGQRNSGFLQPDAGI